MEETKRCPYCAETILAAALKCRYCQSEFTTSSSNVVPKVASCPECRIALVSTQERNFVSVSGCFGALLFLIGVVCCFTMVLLFPGLVLMALGVILSAVGGTHTVMVCPGCEGRDMIRPQFLVEAEHERSKNLLAAFVVVAVIAFLVWIVVAARR